MFRKEFLQKHKYRIVYSKIESINDVDDIEHPAVKGVLKYYNSLIGLEIHHDGDLPARSGLGSSSSFTVGMVNAMNAFEGVYKSPYELASTAIHIEQNLIKECERTLRVLYTEKRAQKTKDAG